MPLDKTIQYYVNHHGLDYVEALKLTEKKKNYLISENIQFLIKSGFLNPKDALSLFGKAYNIVQYKNVCKLITHRIITIDDALVMYREDCDKFDIDNIFELVRDELVEFQTIIKLEDQQFGLLRNDALVQLIRTATLSLEQVIQLNFHNMRYFFSKEIMYLFKETEQLSFEQIKSLKPRDFKNILKLFEYINRTISIEDVLSLKQLQSDIIHCDRIFKLIPAKISLEQALALSHEQLGFFESDELFPFIDKQLLSLEQILSIQNNLLMHQDVKELVMSNPNLITDILSYPADKELHLLTLLNIPDVLQLIKEQKITFDLLKPRHKMLISNPNMIELIKQEKIDLATIVDIDIYHSQLLSKRLSDSHTLELFKQHLVSIPQLIRMNEFHIELLKNPILLQLIESGVLSTDELSRLNRDQCGALIDKLSVEDIFNQFVAGKIRLVNLVVLPLEIAPELTRLLNNTYPLASASLFSPPKLFIQLPEHIDSVPNRQLSS